MIDDSTTSEIVQYLRSKAKVLLDNGIDETEFVQVIPGSRMDFMPRIKEAEAFARLLPKLLSELDIEFAQDYQWKSTYFPIRARPTTNPSHYEKHGGRLLPTKWAKRINQENIRAYGWLLGILSQQLLPSLELDYRKILEDKHVLLTNREGKSKYALHDVKCLTDYVERIEATISAVRRGVIYIENKFKGQVIITTSAPNPLPNSEAWLYAVQIMHRWYKPSQFIRQDIINSLSNPIEFPSIPFLFQRYAGLHIVDTLKMFGWESNSNELITCFIGGKISFSRENKLISMWIEPRLGRDHPSGYSSTVNNNQHEQTPDFLIVHESSRPGPQAFVLDATLMSNRDDLEKKTSKYIGNDGILESNPSSIAGCKIRRLPVRSWAISCTYGTRENNAFARDASTGVIPLIPSQKYTRPLELFIRDIHDL